MTEDEATRLRAIGTSLVSDKRWWGDEVDAEDGSERSVVQCHRLAGSEYSVRIRDAVGAIGLGELQLIVDSKIPLNHLLYLFGHSGLYPRTLLEKSHLGVDASFFAVIAAWYTDACERLLRRGLVSDYSRATNDLPCTRGQIHTVATARSVMVGRPRIRCDYDVWSENTSLNRVIKAATLRLLNSPALPDDLRSRCRRIQYRLSDVGPLQQADMRAKPDLLTRAYHDVHSMSLLILSGSGIAMSTNDHHTWTFLCRTPEAVEAGVRNYLAARLGSRWSITKRGLLLRGSSKRVLNPDLVFGDINAVGDVKYKVSHDGSLSRTDLYQITTFATGYCVPKATVIGFSPHQLGEVTTVGSIEIACFNWPLNGTDPATSANDLARNLENWLTASQFDGRR